MKITKKILREMIKEEFLEVCSSNAVDADDDDDYQLIHVPSLLRLFKQEIEGSVEEEDPLLEGMDCSVCIKNYLLSLNKAILASKGSLIKKA